MTSTPRTEIQGQNTTATSAQPKAQAGCCGGAAPEGSNACCALDASVKSAGGSGCGCATKTDKKGCC